MRSGTSFGMIFVQQNSGVESIMATARSSASGRLQKEAIIICSGHEPQRCCSSGPNSSSFRELIFPCKYASSTPLTSLAIGTIFRQNTLLRPAGRSASRLPACGPSPCAPLSCSAASASFSNVSCPPSSAPERDPLPIAPACCACCACFGTHGRTRACCEAAGGHQRRRRARGERSVEPLGAERKLQTMLRVRSVLHALCEKASLQSVWTRVLRPVHKALSAPSWRSQDTVRQSVQLLLQQKHAERKRTYQPSGSRRRGRRTRSRSTCTMA
mmetsp:Transcript_2145/g.14145  ORF Transcript_2145/g.14145 Transcript_2145/m.14145 type:complete len:271 (+) Transcript_2145:2597-3409(+)